MSGDVVVLGDIDGRLEKLVRGIATLERLPAKHALIGGLAVMARLAQRHRATADIDAVYEDGSVDVTEILVEHGATLQPDGVILPQGVKLDLIAVGDLDPADLPADPHDRAFILGHRWALDSASDVAITVLDATQQVRLEVSIPVATTAALVANKLNAAFTRRAGRAPKRASDVFDVIRLLETHDADGSISSAFADAPEDLAALACDFGEQVLNREAERSVRWLRVDGGPEMQAFRAEDLRSVGEPFIARLREL